MSIPPKVPTPKAKRAMDIVFSLAVLVVTLPLTVLILAAIFIDHLLRGRPSAPLFYAEERVSQGKPFAFFKFNVFKPRVIRSMRERGEFIHTKKLEHDGRSLTGVGWVVQHLYLDELPQFWCVLKGDMSLVGPRPVNPVNYQKHVDAGIYTKTVIRAGLTGAYQIHKGEPGMGQDRLDRAYIEFCRVNPGWRIALHDLGIIIRTPIIMLKAKGY